MLHRVAPQRVITTQSNVGWVGNPAFLCAVVRGWVSFLNPAYIFWLVVIFPVVVGAQPRVGDRVPLERPVLPSLEREDVGVLPVIPIPQSPDTLGWVAGQRVVVGAFRVVGSTVLSKEDIDALAAPYLNRELVYTELAAFRDSITAVYIKRGFINSGAVIPAQTVEQGVVEIQIVEGRLTDIEYINDGRFQKRYVTDRLQRGVSTPLNINLLEQQLQVLQQDDRIQLVQASLVPAEERGAAKLRLHLLENNPVRFGVDFDNYESPSVGAEAGRVHIAHTNIAGYGDRVRADFDRSKGLRAASVRYQAPLNTRDLMLDVYGKRSRSDVVEAPFDELDIESKSDSYAIALRYPLTHTPSLSTSISASAEYRRSESFLLGQPFAFDLGAEKGVSKVAVLRLGYDWSKRSRFQAVAARSQLNVGLDALGSTVQPGDIPDSRFFSVLLQTQWARRFKPMGTQLLARGDAQFSDSPLLGLEQFSIGGHATVRGYRESTLVRDQGWVASFEARVPVLDEGVGRRAVGMGFFVDHGRAWNRDRASGAQKQLSSAGLNVLWAVNRHVDVNMDLAKRLNPVPDSASHDLQDEGVHLSVAVVY